MQAAAAAHEEEMQAALNRAAARRFTEVECMREQLAHQAKDDLNRAVDTVETTAKQVMRIWSMRLLQHLSSAVVAWVAMTGAWS